MLSRRGSVVAELLILALTGLVGLGGAALLQSPAARQAGLRQLSKTVEKRLGVAFSAEDFRWDPRSDRLVLVEPRLGAPKATPALSARELAVEVRLSEVLFGKAIELRALEIEAPVLDLAAPLPELGTGEEAPAGKALVVRRLRVRGGRVEGSNFRVREIAASGALTGGSLRLDLEGADLEAVVGDRQIALHANGRMSGPVAGPWQLARLGVTGEGLEAELSGEWGLAERDPARIRFRVTAQPGRLLAGEPGGELTSEGEVDWRAGSGRVTWELVALPATLLAAFVDESPLRLDGLELASRGQLELGPMDLTRAAGHLGAVVSQRGVEIARLSLEPAPSQEDRLDLPLDLELFPTQAGRRRVTARLTLPTAGAEWGEWLDRIRAQARWSDGRLTLEEPDLASRLTRTASLVPALALPEGARPPDGALRLTGSFDGPLLDPRIDVSGSGSAQGLTARLSARGRPAAGTGRLELTASRIDFPLPGLPQVAGSGSASLWAERLEGGELAGAVKLAAPELALVLEGGERRFTGLELAAALSAGRLRIDRFAGSSGGLTASASGWLAVPDPLHPWPLSRGRLEGMLDSASDPFAPLPVVAELERGAVRVELPEIRTAAGSGEVGHLEARLPIDGAGRVRAAFSLPTVDWAPWLEELGAAGELESLVTAVDGELDLDPARPLGGSATVVLRETSARGWRRAVVTEGAIPLELRDGVLELGLTQAISQPEVGALETLAVRGRMVVEPAWEPGQPLAAAVTSVDFDATADLPAALVVPFAPPSAGLEGEGRVSLFVAATGPPDALEAELWLAGEEAVWRLAEPALELRALELVASLSAGRLELDGLALELNGLSVAARGWAEKSGDRLTARLTELEASGCAATAEASLPLSLLRGEAAGGAVRAAWRIETCDWSPVMVALGGGVEGAVLAGLEGSLDFDLERPAAGRGTLELFGLAAEVSGRGLSAKAPLRLEWAEGEVTLAPLELEVAGQALEAAGRARLDPAWVAERPIDELVRDLELDVRGRVLADLARPMLGGGRAEGALDVEVHLEGAPRSLSGQVLVDGSTASFALFAPYFTRVVEPRIEAELRDGRLRIRRGSLLLNEGPVEISGDVDFAGAVDLAASFDQVRYRLDYGLLAFLGGNLRWSGQWNGSSTISGGVSLDRGILTRPIELDREFLVALLSPVDLTGTSGGFLEQVGLDLLVATGEGVRVRNNLADLLVRWEPLEVTGTLAYPIIKGTVEVDPGGVVRAFNQTIRLERAALTYTGEPGAEPILDLVTTDSAADPSIESLARQGAGTLEDPPDYEELGEDIASSLGTPIVGRLGAALGGTEIRLQRVVPVAVFGEADPSARLNVTRDFSAQVAVVASVDLRSAENQTYILDLHDFPAVPSLGLQAFTLDDGREGGALQQSLELGGAGGERGGPRLRRLSFDRPQGVSRRGLRRAMGVDKGEPLPAGGTFAVEVEVFEYLRRRGFADPRVVVEATPVERGEAVVLDVGIETGPRVAFRFDGDRPPRRLRESITALYRPEPFEAPTLAEMKAQTIRVFRSRGHLGPEVTVEARPAGEEEGSFDRVVEVRTTAGPKVELGAPVFEGIPEADSTWVARRFWGPVQRAELAVGLEEADARVAQALLDLGYAEPSVLGRELDGERLTVQVSATGRRQVTAVETRGLPAGFEAEPALAVGEPLRSDRIGAAVVGLERGLQERGHFDAVVRARLEDDDETPHRVRVLFEATPGPVYEVASVEVEGVRATRPEWAQAVAGLPEGDLLLQADLQAARRRLYGTGLFSSVSYRLERDPTGDADVILELAERPRFRVAYGVRWDSTDGASALFEAEDRNFLGRDLDLAFRALWANEDYSARTFFGVPRLFGSRASLELFGLGSRQVDQGLIRDRAEATVQVAVPLSSRFTGRAYLRYRNDELREEDPDPFFPIMERIKSPLLGLQLLYEDRVDRTFPEDGFFGSIDLSGADDRIGGDFRYLRLFAQLHWYRSAGSLGGRRAVWAQSYRFGVAEPFGDQELIFQNRFFAGGEYSVRGYDRDSLGPQERLGSIVRPAGGEALMVINQELRVRLGDTLTALAFADFGNVWASKTDFGSDLVTALGLGVRATTPLGLLRLDVAHPLDRRPDESSWRVHFGLGNVF